MSRRGSRRECASKRFGRTVCSDCSVQHQEKSLTVLWGSCERCSTGWLCSGEAVRDAAQAGSSPRALSSPTGQSFNRDKTTKMSGHSFTSMLYPTSAGSWGHPGKTSEVEKCVHKGEVWKAKMGTAWGGLSCGDRAPTRKDFRPKKA